MTTAERIAANESAFRDANERIEEAADLMVDLDEIPLICECARTGCTEIARLKRAEYEHVRRRGDTFWVVPGHEATEAGEAEEARVVERNERFVVMQKLGEAGAVAVRLDPRAERGAA